MLKKLREFLKTKKSQISLATKTKKGQIIVGAIGVLGIFLVVLVVLFLVLKGFQVSETPVIIKPPAGSEVVGEKAKVESKKEAPEIGDEKIEGFEVYEYKDPFEPIVSVPSDPATTTSTETTDGVSDSGVLILVLEDIYTENEVKYASIRYGSTIYKVTEGDRVDDSPYQVVSIGEDSVTLLYGEDLIEIKLGEEIIK
ncbi:hypothetical protein [Candidatus Oleimmundimicrobium sp.]|uniref:hypothetical protein n=1 Tax=Candidatus Oleimmundimicrobium sp. TaxID=3060597 RepID=UPI0027229AD8|nr:hypothetical protein [Candidatus Oleimmundimicrobium sp.]MDO8886431.1 hypothetical protein [Candidatus Oleimmundimicrobium sp.]